MAKTRLKINNSLAKKKENEKKKKIKRKEKNLYILSFFKTLYSHFVYTFLQKKK